MLRFSMILCASFSVGGVEAFMISKTIVCRKNWYPRIANPSTTTRVNVAAGVLTDDDSDRNNPAMNDLTSALARLDQQWKMQQRGQARSRWRKIVLSSSDDGTSTEVPPETITAPTVDFCYLLEPPANSLPSCLIVFTGGAGLGTYPQIAYNEFLLRLSNRLNAAVLTAPYAVGLDHFALAQQTGDVTRRAILHCRDDPTRQYPAALPTYSLSHSLGSKLSCIYIAAVAEQMYNGIGYISFNNFSFGKTISMAKEFAETIRKSTGMDNQVSGVSSEALNSLFNFAEMAVSAVGIEFSPSKTDMDRLISLKYDTEQQVKTRLFTFDEDVLENTRDVYDLCNGQPSVSALPGTHLTPVYFKLGLEDLGDLPSETRDMAREAMSGFQSASFGNEMELDILVTEVCDWIMGKGPTRKPTWMRERPQIAAGSLSQADNQ